MHSPYGFSSIERIVKCAGSRALCELYPPPQDTMEQMEGTAAHWAWLQMLLNVPVTVGTIAPNSIPLTEEMIDGAELFVETLDATGVPRNMMMAEQTVVASKIAPENWGTPDVFIVRGDKKRIDAYEYKYGHRYVEVFDNWQIVNQIWAVAEMLQLDDRQEQEWIVGLHVIQPRSYVAEGPVRSYETHLAMLNRQRTIIKGSIESAKREKAMCFTGSHCLDCSASARCTTLQRSSYIGCDIAYENTPINLPPPAAATELRKLQHYKKMIDAREKGLSEQVRSYITKGEYTPGYKLERGMGRLNWIKPIPEIIEMVKMLGVDIRKDKCDTPTQTIKKGIPEEIINTLAERHPSDLKLVQDDGTAARKAFFHTDKAMPS